MKKKSRQSGLRQIPSVDAVLSWPELKQYLKNIQHDYITQLVRTNIDDVREQIRAGMKYEAKGLKQRIMRDINDLLSPYFCYAINATGIILHTGLGRAPFSKGIADVTYAVSRGFSRLQIDDEGRRADRYTKISRLLQIISGAEAGFIVNNNAAATLLVLNTLAKGKEVVGQRLPVGERTAGEPVEELEMVIAMQLVVYSTKTVVVACSVLPSALASNHRRHEAQFLLEDVGEMQEP